MPRFSSMYDAIHGWMDGQVTWCHPWIHRITRAQRWSDWRRSQWRKGSFWTCWIWNMLNWRRWRKGKMGGCWTLCLMHKCVCIWWYILQNYNYKLHFQMFVCLLYGSSTKSFPFFLSSFFPLSFWLSSFIVVVFLIAARFLVSIR